MHAPNTFLPKSTVFGIHLSAEIQAPICISPCGSVSNECAVLFTPVTSTIISLKKKIHFYCRIMPLYADDMG
jgi:hypothetical protein